MRSFTAAFTALALSGAALTAPLATQQLSLSDSSDSAALQQQILQLEQTLVFLSHDIANSNDQSAHANFNTGNAGFATMVDQVIGPGLICPTVPYTETTMDTEQALFALSTTQSHLAKLLLHLQDPNSPESTTAVDFCNAQVHFQRLQQAREISASDSSTTSTAGLETLSGAYITSRIALDALISALSASPYSSASSQQAYATADAALAAFKLAANPKHGVQCQPGAPAPLRSPSDAVNRVSIVEKAAETAFADSRENNGKSFYSFCNVENYMGSVRGFVQAW